MSDDPERTLTSVGLVGTGATGGRVARHLDARAQERPGQLDIVVHDERAALATTLAEHLGPDVRAGAPEEALGCDVVVLASASPQAEPAAEVVGRGGVCITTSDELSDVRDLLELDEVARRNGGTIVVGAGLAPGLSGLLAASLASRLDNCSEIHIAIHGTGGPACARRHHKALRGIAIGWHGGEWIERPAGSGRELCWFPDPVNARDCYRAELADPLLVHSAIPGLERISARLSATRRDRFTAPFPMLRPPHREGGVGALRVEARGLARRRPRVARPRCRRAGRDRRRGGVRGGRRGGARPPGDWARRRWAWSCSVTAPSPRRISSGGSATSVSPWRSSWAPVLTDSQ